MLITKLFYFVWRSSVEVKLDTDVSGVIFLCLRLRSNWQSHTTQDVANVHDFGAVREQKQNRTKIIDAIRPPSLGLRGAGGGIGMFYNREIGGVVWKERR